MNTTACPLESTVLAWICRVAEPEVLQAAAILGVRFSPRYFRSLRDMVRIAYHLGVVVERRPARGAHVPPLLYGRCAAWLRVDEREGEKYCCLWGMEDGEVAVRLAWYQNGDGEHVRATYLEDCPLKAYQVAYARAGARLRACSWLIPVAQVH